MYKVLSAKAVEPIVTLLNEAKDLLVHAPKGSPEELMKTFDFVGKI